MRAMSVAVAISFMLSVAAIGIAIRTQSSLPRIAREYSVRTLAERERSLVAKYSTLLNETRRDMGIPPKSPKSIEELLDAVRDTLGNVDVFLRAIIEHKPTEATITDHIEGDVEPHDIAGEEDLQE